MDCGFNFSEKEFNKLRIFLSYGHDHNEELVRMIKTDIEKRGHDVWFDKNEIKFGDEWRRSITDGIIGSNRVLTFLSKHSTRDPGVCRDEIAIAIGVKGGNIQTILVESEKEVQPPVNIGHIQWLDMHDWQEKKAANEAEWEKWYQAKLAEIVRVVESEETRRFAGEIEKLNEYLKPIKSDARISGLLSKGFYGREWLFKALENWRSETPSPLGGEGRGMGLSRVFWIMGDPGVGKSAFAAQLTHTHGDKVIAAQFVEWDKPDHRDARRVVCSIAFQMATRLPDYRKLLLTLPEIKELDRKYASELFDYLLANPLKSVINGGREKLLIVIDALDEAGELGRNQLVEMLARNAHHLPAWLGMVVTSRPEFDVKTTFQALNPLPLDTKSESNKADIRAYLDNKLATQLQNKPNPEVLVNQILEKSEGVFLYAERFCEDVYQGHISLNQPDHFPQGLGGIFAQYFQRQFSDLDKFRKEIRPALRAILAAREPLPIEILQKLFNWQDEELRDFTQTLGSLFPITKTMDSETIKPYHKSLADWLGDEAKAGVYFVSVMEGHKMLAELGELGLLTLSGVTIFEGNDNFWARNYTYHCCQSKSWDKLIKCFTESSFFWKLATMSYDLGYFQGVLFDFSPTELLRQVLSSLPNNLRSTVCWDLANGMALRANDFQTKIFAFAKQHGQGTNIICRYLRQQNPVEFNKLRDTIYSFTQLAGISAEFACAAYRDNEISIDAINQFNSQFLKVHSYLKYLSFFATTEGWSGALENEATEAYFPWERLIGIEKKNLKEDKTI